MKNPDKVLKAFTQVGICLLIYACITCLWEVAEQFIYGSVQPRIIDDVIAILFTLSIYKNLGITIQVSHKDKEEKNNG